MMTTKDYYEVLGVDRNSSADEIKRAYRKLAREHHPDVNSHRPDEAEATFKEIGTAYAVLSDEQKRARYDQFGPEGVDNGFASGGAGAGGLGDLFEVFFSGVNAAANQRAQESIRRGADLRTNIRMSLEEVYAGVTRELDIPTLLTCDTCNGVGAQPGTDVESCSACKGAGRLREVRQTFFGQFVQEVPCVKCGGRGKTFKTPCASCAGQGRKRGKRRVSVQIPPGVDEGDRVRVVGAGEDGEAGAIAGDLYCLISIEQHKNFQRRDDDVLHVVPISFPQAALGDSIEVATLERDEDGELVKAEITVPAGTQNGALFRVNGKGFPTRYGTRGDQICVARVVVPTKLQERQKELLREFAEISDQHPEEHPRGFFDKLKDVFGVD